MALPVISACNRVALEWTNTGGGWPPVAVNVLHCFGAPGNEADIAGALNSTLFDNQNDALFSLHEDYSLTNISVTPLNGTSAAQVFPQTGTAGHATGDPIPQCAVVWTWYTGHRGPSGRGRIYLGPISEAVQDDGNLIVGTADPGTAIQAILDDMDGAGFPLQVASYVHAVARPITSFTIHPVIRTQRRRGRP